MFAELTPLIFIILALAAARLTRLVTRDTIPLVAKPRKWLHSRYPDDGDYVHRPVVVTRRWVNYLFTARWARKLPALTKPNYRAMPAGQGGEAERWFVLEGHWIGKLTSCDWCAGVWVSALIFLSFALWPIGTATLAVLPALAQLVGLQAGHE